VNDQVEEKRRVEHIATCEQYIQNSVQDLTGKKSTGRPKRRWEDNIKVNIDTWRVRYGLN
jgi:hypothetical protein